MLNDELGDEARLMQLFFIPIEKGTPVEITAEDLDNVIQKIREDITLKLKESTDVSGIMIQYGFNYFVNINVRK